MKTKSEVTYTDEPKDEGWDYDNAGNRTAFSSPGSLARRLSMPSAFWR
jgi:hypothetical protein